MSPTFIKLSVMVGNICLFQKRKSEELTIEEMGLAGASADDTEAEFLRAITEHHIVTGKSAPVGPLT